jgi:hypothetical protein
MLHRRNLARILGALLLGKCREDPLFQSSLPRQSGKTVGRAVGEGFRVWWTARLGEAKIA